MGPFEMVVFIVAITVIGGITREYLKRQEVKGGDLDAINERLEQMEKLEERVQVLESIVTNPKEDLKRKIDEL